MERTCRSSFSCVSRFPSHTVDAIGCVPRRYSVRFNLNELSTFPGNAFKVFRAHRNIFAEQLVMNGVIGAVIDRSDGRMLRMKSQVSDGSPNEPIANG